jgi:hypothetical protein
MVDVLWLIDDGRDSSEVAMKMGGGNGEKMKLGQKARSCRGGGRYEAVRHEGIRISCKIVFKFFILKEGGDLLGKFKIVVVCTVPPEDGIFV